MEVDPMILTADEAAQVPTGYVVVEGEWECCDGASPICPPCQAENVAPKRWTDLDTKCEFCGSGLPDAPWIQNCLDCHGSGRTIHELRVVCSTCEGTGRLTLPSLWYWQTCPHCNEGRGTVSLGSFTVKVLPVFGRVGHRPPKGSFVLVGNGCWLIGDDPEEPELITLARVPVPDRDFVVALTEQETS